MKKNLFNDGFIAIVPILPGIIPFGAVMGTVSANAKLTLFETITMNALLYAGASQLAAIELMTKHAAVAVVVVTGLIINLRFVLYSAAMSPSLHTASLWKKVFCAFTLTDQSYAVVSANQSKLSTPEDVVSFYCGTAVCLLMTWHPSVIAGYIFGNFAPPSFALDYAVPLSFVALLIPTIRNKTYLLVAMFSAFVSVLLYNLPFRTGLIATALISVLFASLLTRKKKT